MLNRPGLADNYQNRGIAAGGIYNMIDIMIRNRISKCVFLSDAGIKAHVLLTWQSGQYSSVRGKITNCANDML